MSSTTEAAPVHVTVIGHHKVVFADAGHAQALAEQWNSDHAHQIAEARAEGYDSYADGLTAAVETWSPADLETQPLGMHAVRTELPAHTTLYCRRVSYVGYMPRRRLNDSGLLVLHLWDFESNYTVLAVDGQLEDRSAGTLDVKVSGTNRDAVEARFAELASVAEGPPGQHDLLWPLDVLGIVLHSGPRRRRRER